MNDEKILVSTPIFYSNGDLHAGHLYSLFIASVFVKMQRNKEVKFTTGLDQHGPKVQKAAGNQNPQIFVDHLAKDFKELCNRAQIIPDKFITTSSSEHKKIALDLWSKIQHDLYEDFYSGWYDTSDEAFVAEKTNNSIWVAEKCIFFRLSKYKEVIKDYLLNSFSHSSFQNEALKMLENLRDLCVTRSCSWGIAIDDKDPQKTMYVWVDALSNYLTFGSEYLQNGIHIIGKDILRFHAIYWIGLLASAKLPFPKKLVVHGWWIAEKAKMSKSVGNVIYADELLDKFHPDILRWFFIFIKRLETDAELSIEIIVQSKIELANTIGNLVNRLLCIAFSYQFTNFNQEKSELTKLCYQAADDFDLKLYATYIFEAAKKLNQEIELTQPWKLDSKAAHIFLSSIIPKLYELIDLIEPITPQFSDIWKKQIDQIGYNKPVPVIL